MARRSTYYPPAEGSPLPLVVSDLTVNGSLNVKGPSRLQGGEFAPRPYFFATRLTNQAAANVTETRLNFDNVVVAPNPSSALVTGAGVWLWTAPIAGVYLVSASVVLDTWGTTGDTVLILRTSSSLVPEIRGTNWNPLGASGSTYRTLSICVPLPLKAGEAYRLNIYQGTGAPRDVRGSASGETWMSCLWAAPYAA